MPRIRTIKPDFPQSESMGRVSRDARLLFVNLWTICDDSGRTRGNSRILASILFPYDDVFRFIDKWIQELIDENCIIRYEVEGCTYIQVNNWLKHQKIDHPAPSKIPPCDENSRVIREDSRELREDSRVSPSFSPRIGRDRKGKDRKRNGKEEDMSSDLDIVTPVLQITNQVLGKNFKGSKDAIANIKARLKEGRAIDDFKTVCVNMLAHWGNDPKMSQYLCPDTLYGNKFDKYLNMGLPPRPDAILPKSNLKTVNAFLTKMEEKYGNERTVQNGDAGPGRSLLSGVQ